LLKIALPYIISSQDQQDAQLTNRKDAIYRVFTGRIFLELATLVYRIFCLRLKLHAQRDKSAS